MPVRQGTRLPTPAGRRLPVRLNSRVRRAPHRSTASGAGSRTPRARIIRQAAANSDAASAAERPSPSLGSYASMAAALALATATSCVRPELDAQSADKLKIQIKLTG